MPRASMNSVKETLATMELFSKDMPALIRWGTYRITPENWARRDDDYRAHLTRDIQNYLDVLRSPKLPVLRVGITNYTDRKFWGNLTCGGRKFGFNFVVGDLWTVNGMGTYPIAVAAFRKTNNICLAWLRRYLAHFKDGLPVEQEEPPQPTPSFRMRVDPPSWEPDNPPEEPEELPDFGEARMVYPTADSTATTFSTS